MKKILSYFGRLFVLIIVVILAATAHINCLHAGEHRLSEEATQHECVWKAEAVPSLDSTYRWHGLYLGGIERAITVIVQSNAIQLFEKNAKAIDGLNYKLKLIGGMLDTSRQHAGRLTLHGNKIEGEIITERESTIIKSGRWLFETTDCGTTFRLLWELDDATTGEYVFGPTGYEWPHGANMASTAIYRN